MTRRPSLSDSWAIGIFKVAILTFTKCKQIKTHFSYEKDFIVCLNSESFSFSNKRRRKKPIKTRNWSSQFLSLAFTRTSFASSDIFSLIHCRSSHEIATAAYNHRNNPLKRENNCWSFHVRRLLLLLGFVSLLVKRRLWWWCGVSITINLSIRK